VLDFVDWIARRCGGEITQDGGSVESETQSVLQVAQTISVIISLAERGDEQDVVTLSTLHAAKGLEWPHVVLAGVNEGLLPFSSSGDEEMTPERLEEERRLMYVGITRARTTLMVSTLRRRKRGRETVAGVPSRFIAEMKLDEARARKTRASG
jgi:ATP-dependent DNA helicase Rep